MKAYAKILGVVLVGLAIQLALAAGDKGVGDSLVSRAFTVVSNINSLVSRAFTVSTSTDSLVSRAFTVTSNTDSLVSRAFTVTSNTDSLVSRAFTAVNCEDGDGGLCPDCDDNGIPDQCELDCGEADGPCDIEGCGLSDDCNGNGVPDECEILDCTGEPECSDCNENGIPDGCEPDCNDNTVPDDCDIDPEDPDENGEVSNDCNENGIPDECEPDCRGDGIPDECEITGCGGDPECSDCNGNGIPDGCDLDSNDPDGNGEVSGDCDDDGVLDECEIADCDGSPECGDCNVNGIPDGCDIDSGFSQDVEPPPDGDDVPDECVVWNGESKENDQLWSTDDNWEGDDAPGDGDPNDLESVVIAAAGANVILDVDADNPNIDSLLLDSDTTLHVTGGDLSVVDPLGNFDGNILVRGDLKIGDGRSIDAEGEVTIGPGGIYHAEDPNDLLLDATLEAGSITVQGGSLEQGGGGSLMLSGSMGVVVQGNLNLETGPEDDDKGCDAPPDLNTTDSAELNVQGDLILTGRACVRHDSSMAVVLQGDFDNFSTDPDIFEWFDVEGSGELQMNGTSQTIEAAGEDRGPCPAGLNANFAIGTLTVMAGSITQVVDVFDNQGDGQIACDEALYVGILILEAGSELLTNGCRVYYEELINDGWIPGHGTDVLQVESTCADLDGDGAVGAFDLALLLGSWGPCPPDADCPADLSGDGNVGAFDLALLLGRWGPIP